MNIYHHHLNEEPHIGVRDVSKKRRALHNLMRLPGVCPWQQNWLEIGRLFGQLAHCRAQSCQGSKVSLTKFDWASNSWPVSLPLLCQLQM